MKKRLNRFSSKCRKTWGIFRCFLDRCPPCCVLPWTGGATAWGSRWSFVFSAAQTIFLAVFPTCTVMGIPLFYSNHRNIYVLRLILEKVQSHSLRGALTRWWLCGSAPALEPVRVRIWLFSVLCSPNVHAVVAHVAQCCKPDPRYVHNTNWTTVEYESDLCFGID